jgi:hypothetical protein
MAEDSFFINRDSELGRFRATIESQIKSVLVVWGDGGYGKSALLRRMERDCCTRKVRVEWRPTRPYDFVGVMSCIADGIGPADFDPFHTMIDRFAEADRQISLHIDAPSITVAQGARFEGTQNVTATGIRIDQVVAPAQRNGIGVGRMARLTDCFIEALDNATRSSPVVVFLDAFEKAGPDTSAWFWYELVAARRDDRLANVRFTVFTRDEPRVDHPIGKVVEAFRLEPLSPGHIADYMRRRGIPYPPDVLDTIAGAVLVSSEGNMLRIASAVEAMLAKTAASAAPHG